jgi:hypothetical protein
MTKAFRLALVALSFAAMGCQNQAMMPSASMPMPMARAASTPTVFRLDGRVTTIDSKRKLFRIATKEHGEKQITTTAATKIGEKFGDFLAPKTFEYLKVGKTVTIWLKDKEAPTKATYEAETVAIEM